MLPTDLLTELLFVFGLALQIAYVHIRAGTNHRADESTSFLHPWYLTQDAVLVGCSRVITYCLKPLRAVRMAHNVKLFNISLPALWAPPIQ